MHRPIHAMIYVCVCIHMCMHGARISTIAYSLKLGNSRSVRTSKRKKQSEELQGVHEIHKENWTDSYSFGTTFVQCWGVGQYWK